MKVHQISGHFHLAINPYPPESKDKLYASNPVAPKLGAAARLFDCLSAARIAAMKAIAAEIVVGRYGVLPSFRQKNRFNRQAVVAVYICKH